MGYQNPFGNLFQTKEGKVIQGRLNASLHVELPIYTPNPPIGSTTDFKVASLPEITDKDIEKKFPYARSLTDYGAQIGAKWLRDQQRVNLREELIKFLEWLEPHNIQDFPDDESIFVDEYLSHLKDKVNHG